MGNALMHLRKYRIPTVIIAIAILIAAVGTYFAIRQAQFNSASIVTTATVTDIGFRGGSSASGNYVPTFTFTNSNGEPQTATTGPYSSTLWDYQIGESVEIRYDPATPHVARPTGFFSTWLIPILLGGLSLLIALFGVGVGLVIRKWGHDPDDELDHIELV